MKFVHIADMHFDRPFINLSDKDILGEKRRLEQRKVFKKIIDYIKENEIEYLFISGDLYEHEYVKKSTIEYINSLFKQIPDTLVFISPGNHDPNLKNSYYNRYKWNDNVFIFSNKIERVNNNNVDVYGYGFDDFYCNESNLKELKIENSENINVLVIHGDLDGVKVGEKQYNPINKNVIENKNFDYIALGHIHKRSISNNIVYPGSTVSLGFDELGKHGMIVGNITKESLNLEFVPLDEEEFVERNVEISDINSKEELIEHINSINVKENEYLKIILVGNRNFEINTYELIKYIDNNRILKIKDNTSIAVDLEKLEKQNTLKGIFVKKMRKKLDDAKSEEEKNILEKAIEIGLESLE